jgi:nicotinate-nucleotide pyrophosphorylase (carboxylating)
MASLIFKDLLVQALNEDGAGLDWTSRGTLLSKKNAQGKAKVIAKSKGIWAGEMLAQVTQSLSQEMGAPFTIKMLVKDGDRLLPGDVVCEWKGSLAGILALERPFLNLCGFSGGIAQKTRTLVDLMDSKWKTFRLGTAPPRLTLTRKTLPYYRDLSILAVMAGRGHAHRVSLSGGVLIKENHIEASGSIKRAIDGVKKTAPHSLKIEIEVRNIEELKQALGAHADVIMLDNFNPEQVKAALKVVDAATKSESTHRPTIEVSGGIQAENIQNFVMPGVDVISVGSLTHSVTAIDLSLLVQ